MLPSPFHITTASLYITTSITQNGKYLELSSLIHLFLFYCFIMHLLILYPLQQVERQIVLHLSSEESATTGHLPAACGHVVVIILNDRIGNQLYIIIIITVIFSLSGTRVIGHFLPLLARTPRTMITVSGAGENGLTRIFSTTLDTGSSMNYVLAEAGIGDESYLSENKLGFSEALLLQCKQLFGPCMVSQWSQ
jgi:hypothetical protein